MKISKPSKPLEKIIPLNKLKCGETFRYPGEEVIYMVASIDNTNKVHLLTDIKRITIVNLETGDIMAPIHNLEIVRVNVNCSFTGDA